MEITYERFQATHQSKGLLLILVAKEVTVWLADDAPGADEEEDVFGAQWHGATLVLTNVHNDAPAAIATAELDEEARESILQQVADLPEGDAFTVFVDEEGPFHETSRQLMIERLVADGHMPLLDEGN